MTLDEAVDYLRVTKSNLYKLLQKGSIPASKVGGLWRFKKGQLNKWLDERMIRYNKGLENGATIDKVMANEREDRSSRSITIDKIGKIDVRNSPRISVEFPIEIDGGVTASVTNLSETGISILSPIRIKRNRASGVLKFPQRSVNLDIDIIRNGPNKLDDKYLYGAKILNAKHDTILMIQQNMINAVIKDALKINKDKNVKEYILKFYRYFKKYLLEVIELSDKIEKSEIVDIEGQKLFNRLTDDIMKRAGELELTVTHKLTIKKIKKLFRSLVSCWIYKSYIVKRAYDKPRGYPGDHVTIELVYDNKPHSSGIGLYADRYFLQENYAIAVRNRKDKMRYILKNFIENHEKYNLRILNLACGSSREVKELNPIDTSNKKIYFGLLDHDDEALDFSKKSLKELASQIDFDFINEDILDLCRNRENYITKLGKYDFIYSIGLADYLPDRLLKGFIGFCMDSLLPKGRFIFAHKDISIYKPLPPNWFCDWNFYSRTEEQLQKLINESSDNISDNISLDREESNHIIFFDLEHKQTI